MPSKLKVKLKLPQLSLDPGTRDSEPQHQPSSCRESTGHGRSMAAPVRHDSAVDVLALAEVNHEGDQTVPDCVIYADEQFAAVHATATSLVDTQVPDISSCGLGPVFIGSVKAFWNTAWLKANHVTHVLNCAGKLDKAFGPRQHEGLRRAFEAGICVMTLPWRDHCFTDIQPLLPTALQFIARARQGGGGCLVHCAAGRSRSATVVVAYDMLMRNCSLSQSLARMVKRHKTTQPNPGFVEQLRELSGRACRAAEPSASAQSSPQTGFAEAQHSCAAQGAACSPQAAQHAAGSCASSDSGGEDVVAVDVESAFGSTSPRSSELTETAVESAAQRQARESWSQLAAQLAALEAPMLNVPFSPSPIPPDVRLQTPRSAKERFALAGGSSSTASAAQQAASQAETS